MTATSYNKFILFYRIIFRFHYWEVCLSIALFYLLQEGIAVVDTPGIGGSAKMSKYAERYLSKSYGFIYVVNSANAGGVQKGRVRD